MRFYLVDRILEVVPRQRIRAAKLVSCLDPVIEHHPTAGLRLAPPLVIESLAQTSAWLIMASTDFAQRGVLGGFRSITIGRPARVGERLELVSEVESWLEDGVVFHFEASCSCLGEMVVRVEGALCLLIDAGQLEDVAETRQLYHALYPQPAPPEPAAVAVEDGLILPDPPLHPWVPYDVRLPAPGEGRAAAVKSISMMDPIFATHFPRFPTMPGVLLMQSLLHLGRELLQETNPGTTWEAGFLQGVRFQRYIRPGDQLLLQVQTTAATEREATLSGEALVGDQRVVMIRQMRFTPSGGSP